MRRRARLCALLVVVVASATTVRAGQAEAQTGGGELSPGSVRATARDLGAGTFRGTGAPTRAPSTKSSFDSARELSTLACVILADPVAAEIADQVQPVPGSSSVTGNTANAAPADVPAGAVALERALVPPDAVVIGDLVYDVLGGPGLLFVVPRCVGPGTPPPGRPPSPAEIWQETPLPRTVVHASPPGTPSWPGVTQLATHFWGNAVPETRARVVLRGYDVAVVAHPVAYAWDFGEGTTLIRSGPASEDASAPITFVRRGDYRVHLYVVWEARAHISFRGIDIDDEDLGTVTLSEELPYHVAEIRALLRTTPGRG